MNKEEIIIEGDLLTHYINKNEYYEYDSLYYETLNYLDRLQQENKQLKERIDKYKHILEEIKEDLSNALNEGINKGINLQNDTNDRGRYDAYDYVLSKIDDLECEEQIR